MMALRKSTKPKEITVQPDLPMTLMPHVLRVLLQKEPEGLISEVVIAALRNHMTVLPEEIAGVILVQGAVAAAIAVRVAVQEVVAIKVTSLLAAAGVVPPEVLRRAVDEAVLRNHLPAVVAVVDLQNLPKVEVLLPGSVEVNNR